MNADERCVPVVAGLAGYEAAFRAHLSRSGYTPRSAGALLRAMACASRWLEDRELNAATSTLPSRCTMIRPESPPASSRAARIGRSAVPR